jgi:spore cortex biosynthesis protein YabQ
MTLNNQFLTLGLMVSSGLGLGVLFDAYRVLTGQLKFPRWLTAILDILYGLIAALTVFRVLYYSNHGQLRLYVFIGLLAGIFVYYQWFSKMVIWFVMQCIITVQWLIDIFIVAPIKALYKLLKIIFAFLKALTIFFYKLMLQLSYPLRFLMHRLMIIIKRIFHLS